MLLTGELDLPKVETSIPTKRRQLYHNFPFFSGKFSAEVPQFVVALFPIGHEGVVEHRGTGLFEIGFDAVAYRYIGS